MSEFERQQNQTWNSSLVSPAKPDLATHAEPPSLQESWGNQAAQRFAHSCPLRLPSPGACPLGGACHACPAPVQAKLQVNAPGDQYEQEADRVADQVMRMPAPRPHVQRACSACGDEETVQARPLAGQITPLVQRQAEPEEEEEPVQALTGQTMPLVQRQAEPEEGEEEEEPIQTKPIAEQITPLVQRQVEPEEEEEPIQTKRAGGQAAQVSHGLATQIHSLRGGGQPLPPSARGFFEPRFGRDFSQVRVHAGMRAAQAARAISARAFTVGQDVVFGAGQYAPGTAEGGRLLAHELTHVVQQSGTGKSTNTVQRLPIYSGRILNHGSCQHLACNSKWACVDNVNGIRCPSRTRNAYRLAGKKYRPLFSCDIRCERNQRCDPNDNYMAIPHSRYRHRKCNQNLVVCANGKFAHAYVRDRSDREVWEVSPAVLRKLGIAQGDIANGAIYGSENDPHFRNNNLCQGASTGRSGTGRVQVSMPTILCIRRARRLAQRIRQLRRRRRRVPRRLRLQWQLARISVQWMQVLDRASVTISREVAARRLRRLHTQRLRLWQRLRQLRPQRQRSKQRTATTRMTRGTARVRCVLATFRGSHFTGRRVTADIQFIPALHRINNYARQYNVNVHVTHSFRVAGRRVRGSIVRPARMSDHLVGHAIDMNIRYGANGRQWCNSSCLRQRRLPGPIQRFIQAIRNDRSLRWGGDFTRRDVVHIDDYFNANPGAWRRRYIITQQAYRAGCR